MTFDINSLPNDPEKLKQMLLELQSQVEKKDDELAKKDKIITDRALQINQFIERFELAKRKAYGVKSEKHPGAGENFNEAEQTLDEAEQAIVAQGQSSEPQRPKQQAKRKPLPADLPREVVVVDIDDEEKICDCCQGKLHQIGESSNEKLEFVPAQIKIIETRRPKYSCRACEQSGVNNTVKMAPVPASPIPKGIATPSLLSQIICAKYQYGLPLYRQESMFKELGITLSRKTMSDWIMRCGDLFDPLYTLLKRYLLEQRVLNADETTLNVIQEDKATCYMWVYCSGTDKPTDNLSPNIALFDYQNSRRADCVVNYLDGYTGYLQVDGYQAYGQTEAVLAGCMAHARRKFTDAKAAQPKKKTGKADVVLSLIQKLYGIEASLKGKNFNEIQAVRQEKSKPILEKIQSWALAHKEKIPEKSKLGEAIKYWLNQWPKLITYLEDGQITIDNNRAERAIKPFVIGRKGWLFSNTARGAKASATLYSIIETAKANGLLVDGYIQYCLNELAKKPADLAYLLPWNVKQV
ncbi:IS66 family transposase [Thalassomonas viridans]|uniref:IS66 family transposase n=1 Tax=Thalassomonas viridans TaxID=137584 RepID=A0AAF0CAM5_9GAMM|nr:IS66 family transposase [Thalassomonas viridans]WDE06676.1 IS66 family transposase [Thalassomonas viridans]